MNAALFLVVADSPDFWEKFTHQFRSEGAVTLAEIALVAALAAIIGVAVYWVRRSRYLDDHQMVDDARRIVLDLSRRHHLQQRERRLIATLAKEQETSPATLYLRPEVFFQPPPDLAPGEAKRRQDLGKKLFLSELAAN